jgi:6,7-dimethyl-8-ribityllumazine synthase
VNADVTVTTGQLGAEGLRIAVVASRFNEAVVERLVDGAVDALLRHGCDAADVSVAWVPGAWELPVVARALASSGTVDAIAASGCAAVQREFGVPVAFGVLTTDDWDQAVARAGGKYGNKGAEAALSAVETANLLKDSSGR